jgi:hypothetical protein
MVRVFEDGYNLPAAFDTVKVFGIRGEIISGQFAVNAKKNMTNVTVAIGAVKNKTGSSDFPANAIDWNFVGSIPLTANTPNQPLSALTRKAPAMFPEYLMAEKQINIKEKSYQSVWLTISIPETAGSGTYLGKITVKTNMEEQSLPVSITVYPLTLPEKRHLKVVEWYNTEGFARFHGIKEEYSPAWFDMLRKYADNMVAHRQNIFQDPMDAIAISKSKSGELEFDFTRFDQIADVFWNTGKMDFLETGELTTFGEKQWSSTKISLQDFSVKNAENGQKIKMAGKDVIPFLLPSFESHLRQKGWLSKTLFGIKDEPSLHNSLSWQEASSYMHKYAPDLIRIDAIETTNLLNEIEVAIPKLDHFSTWNKTYEEWQQKGHELWFYTVGIYQGSLFPNKTIDVPLGDSRILHWMNYKYDATGYLHWGWNQWTENPYKEVGMHIGDGWHVYPVKDGVVNSLRWEQMRNGIQDYEYFWMLENKIKSLRDSLGTRFSWINPKQGGKEISGNVIKGFAEHSDDPQVLYKSKMELIRELVEFNTTPKIYVQTNPVEKSTMTNHSSVEVYGWTEPGTKIVINGQEIPVSDEGLFLELFQMSGNENRIIVNAKKGNGVKEIVRDFAVETR